MGCFQGFSWELKIGEPGTQNQERPRPNLEWHIRLTGYGQTGFEDVLYRRCGFAYSYDWKGFVGTKKKMSKAS